MSYAVGFIIYIGAELYLFGFSSTYPSVPLVNGTIDNVSVLLTWQGQVSGTLQTLLVLLMNFLVTMLLHPGGAFIAFPVKVPLKKGAVHDDGTVEFSVRYDPYGDSLKQRRPRIDVTTENQTAPHQPESVRGSASLVNSDDDDWCDDNTWSSHTWRRD